jgi:uncharacterized DUF497 family protein
MVRGIIHRVSFEEAASVFLDPAALTFWDPDHSTAEDREITIGRSHSRRFCSLRTSRVKIASESSAHDGRRAGSENSMRKEIDEATR